MNTLHTHIGFFRFLNIIAILNRDECTPFIQIKECKKIDTYFFVKKFYDDDEKCKLSFTFVQRNVNTSNIQRDVVYLYSFDILQDELLNYVFTLPNYLLSTFMSHLTSLHCEDFYIDLCVNNS